MYSTLYLQLLTMQGAVRVYIFLSICTIIVYRFTSELLKLLVFMPLTPHPTPHRHVCTLSTCLVLDTAQLLIDLCIRQLCVRVYVCVSVCVPPITVNS